MRAKVNLSPSCSISIIQRPPFPNRRKQIFFTFTRAWYCARKGKTPLPSTSHTTYHRYELIAKPATTNPILSHRHLALVTHTTILTSFIYSKHIPIYLYLPSHKATYCYDDNHLMANMVNFGICKVDIGKYILKSVSTLIYIFFYMIWWAFALFLSKHTVARFFLKSISI